MKDAAQSLSMRSQQLDHIVMRVAHMNDAGQMALTRQFEMCYKYGALHISRREHPKIVQPELANRHHFWLFRHLAVTRAHLFAMGSRVMRVRADARKDHAGVRLRQRQGMFARSQV